MWSAPNAQLMWASWTGWYSAICFPTNAPTSFMSGVFCRPAVAKAVIRVTISCCLKRWSCTMDSSTMASMASVWAQALLENAHAMLDKSDGAADLIFATMLSATRPKSSSSTSRLLAKANTRCDRSSASNREILGFASEAIAAIREPLCKFSEPNDHATRERLSGAKSVIFCFVSAAIASISTTSWAPHCTIDHEILERLLDVKVEILAVLSLTIADTSCAFHNPHLAKDHAVSESCLWSNS
mmetsp:Transcript_5081/g.14130  ORF Transcript_5081/g.14130 Transcript_5081/m.14130 type:complete len:242 (-) Transcript_5081:736-1461(-)